MSKSIIKGQAHVSSFIVAILFLNNTLPIAHLLFESLGPTDCVLDLCHNQGKSCSFVRPILQSMHSKSALSFCVLLGEKSSLQHDQ